MDLDLVIGATVDRYTIEQEIGSGGMATVYRVRHGELGSVHAMKLLHITSPSVRQRLKREGRLQASLRHPNIVSVTDIVSVDGDPGLVMEFVDGPTLEQFLTQHQPSEAQLDALATGILRGVQAAHQMGMVHRDLKPANILLARTPTGPVAKIADFGLAKALDRGDGDAGALTRSGQAMGTPFYMAPEQAVNARDVDKRVDVWALGAILYEMVTGRRAFEADNLPSILHRVMQGSYEPITDFAPDVPPRMQKAIHGALEVLPEHRIPDVATLIQVWSGGTLKADQSGPWSAEVLRSLDSHADSRSNDFVAQGSGTFDPAALDPHPDAESMVSDSLPAAPPNRRMLYAVIAMAMVGVLLTGVTAAVVLMATIGQPDPDPITAGQTDPEGRTEVVEPAPAAVPSPVAEPAPDVAPDVEPEPQPTPVALPTPISRPEPIVRPVPVAQPIPEPAAPATGTVRATGDAIAVQLRSDSGTFDVGDVPAGTYTIRAVFAGSSAVVDAGSVTVPAGGTVRISCDGGFFACRAQ